MTPSLLQKIELLTLNQLELSDLMTQELVKNPFLEEVAEGGDSERENPPEKAEKETEEKKAAEEFDFEYFFGEYLNPSYRNREFEVDNDRPTFELFLTSTSSLSDHLDWQLNLIEVPDDQRRVTDYIVGNINEDGYLTTSVEEISQALRTDERDVLKALIVVQSLDPVGVCARTLQECLLLQLRAAGLQGSLAERLIIEFLPLIERTLPSLTTRMTCSTA